MSSVIIITWSTVVWTCITVMIFTAGYTNSKFEARFRSTTQFIRLFCPFISYIESCLYLQLVNEAISSRLSARTCVEWRRGKRERHTHRRELKRRQEAKKREKKKKEDEIQIKFRREKEGEEEREREERKKEEEDQKRSHTDRGQVSHVEEDTSCKKMPLFLSVIHIRVSMERE